LNFQFFGNILSKIRVIFVTKQYFFIYNDFFSFRGKHLFCASGRLQRPLELLGLRLLSIQLRDGFHCVLAGGLGGSPGRLQLGEQLVPLFAQFFAFL
jgi:hypothetical protein